MHCCLLLSSCCGWSLVCRVVFLSLFFGSFVEFPEIIIIESSYIEVVWLIHLLLYLKYPYNNTLRPFLVHSLSDRRADITQAMFNVGTQKNAMEHASIGDRHGDRVCRS